MIRMDKETTEWILMMLLIIMVMDSFVVVK